MVFVLTRHKPVLKTLLLQSSSSQLSERLSSGLEASVSSKKTLFYSDYTFFIIFFDTGVQFGFSSQDCPTANTVQVSAARLPHFLSGTIFPAQDHPSPAS